MFDKNYIVYTKVQEYASINKYIYICELGNSSITCLYSFIGYTDTNKLNSYAKKRLKQCNLTEEDIIEADNLKEALTKTAFNYIK